jgi:hypothetical protein
LASDLSARANLKGYLYRVATTGLMPRSAPQLEAPEQGQCT